MRYFIVAGEASGDLHGSNLMKELKIQDANADFQFFGGDLMQQQSPNLLKHYREMAFMGLFDVLMNLKTIKRNMKICEKAILDYQPDVVILIDYAGFNLRIAKFAKQNGLKVFYYISPKLWAWNTKRVKKIKANVDKMFTILPFETEFYAQFGVQVDYIGNPLLDAIHSRPNADETLEAFSKRNNLSDKPIIAILAGSRRQELEKILPKMLTMCKYYPDYQFIIAGAPSFTEKDYEKFIQNTPTQLIFGETYSIVQHAHTAMVTSGTATLETALLNCPQVVCYNTWGGWLIYKIATTFIMKIKYISLVNLILNKECVKELIQTDFTEKMLHAEMEQLVHNKSYRNNMFANYKQLQTNMGQPGSSKKAAQLMVQYLQNR